MPSIEQENLGGKIVVFLYFQNVFFVTGLTNSFSINSICSQSVSPQNTMVQARFTSHLCLGVGFNKVQLRMELLWS